MIRMPLISVIVPIYITIFYYSLPFYRIMRKFYDKVTGVGDKYRID